jgi:hypothetical protein
MSGTGSRFRRQLAAENCCKLSGLPQQTRGLSAPDDSFGNSLLGHFSLCSFADMKLADSHHAADPP